MSTITPNKQALRSQHARQQIVQAALTVFAFKGISGASMDDVCLAAGCSKGGLYHHFPTKVAVLSAVVARLIATGAILPPFEPKEGALGLPSAHIGRILIEIWSEASRSADLRAQLRAGYESQLDATLLGTRDLAEILRIGTLVQLLTRGEGVDAAGAARRLGISRAA